MTKTTIEALVAKWRERANEYVADLALGITSDEVGAIRECADELEAALAALSQDQAKLCPCGAGSAEDCPGACGASNGIPHHPEAQQPEAVDVTGFGTPPLFHEERKDAEQAYTVTAFDYPKAPVGSRDWMLYWRGWWHRSMVYTTPPKPAEAEVEAAEWKALAAGWRDAWVFSKSHILRAQGISVEPAREIAESQAGVIEAELRSRFRMTRACAAAQNR